jgi:hypothetical protein
MTFTEIIKNLFPYLYSLRRLKGYLSFDLVFPTTWEFPDSLIKNLQITQNPGTDNKTITSIVCTVSDDIQINLTLETILDIISHNLEREEKERLLKDKVVELKKLFGKTSLEQLKTLKFEVQEDDTEYEDEWAGGDIEEVVS